MEVCVLASGSSGNACLVRDGDALVLVDAGLSARALAEGMAHAGADPRQVSAILLTHEHGDHVRGAAAFARRFKTPILATEGTLFGARRALEGAATQTITTGRLRWAGLQVTVTRIPHDTREPVCYRFDGPGGAAAVATDMGRLDARVLEALEGVGTLVWESNHDPDLLWTGPYPERLKARIAGGWGHLPNEQSAAGLAQLYRGGLRHVVLAHLSETNNAPEIARETATAVLQRLRRPPALHLAKRHAPTGWVGDEVVMASAPERGRQMTLWDGLG